MTGPPDDQPTIAVIDYGIGNLRSAQKALERVGAIAHLTDDPDVIDQADGVVLPGVGAFGACMAALEGSGLDAAVRSAVDRSVPFLGICVGMQMLFEGSDESPDVPGLGLLPGWIRWLPESVKRPQMQWNRIMLVAGDEHPPLARRVLEGLDGAWMYFVHSLAAETTADTVATADYGGEVVAVVARDNIVATQFHPEKSARSGLALLANFTRACGQAPTPSTSPAGRQDEAVTSPGGGS